VKMIRAGEAALAAHHDDGPGDGGGYDPAGGGLGLGIADAAAAGDCGNRRDPTSMVLSLVVIPAVHFYLADRLGASAGIVFLRK